MRRALCVVLSVLAGVLVASSPAASADEVHGGDAAFTGRGVAVLWAVLRGADEPSTVVVLRVVRLDPAHGALAVEGVDPFVGRRARLAAPAQLGRRYELRVPRAWFATYPRTEIHLAPRLDDLVAGRAAVTIYFTGIPDTTPEFPTEAGVATYLDAAAARLTGANPAR